MPFGELLEQFRLQRTLAELQADGPGRPGLVGVVLAFSKRLVLVRVAGASAFDGYAVVRRADLGLARWGSAELRRRERALGDPGRHDPLTREVRLDDWPAAIESARRAMPLLTVHPADGGPGLTAASETIELMKHLLLADELRPDGAEGGRFALPLDAIARLEFGGEHEARVGRATGLG